MSKLLGKPCAAFGISSSIKIGCSNRGAQHTLHFITCKFHFSYRTRSLLRLVVTVDFLRVEDLETSVYLYHRTGDL